MVDSLHKVVRGRGIFGWLFLILFLAFNAFMLFWLFRLLAYWWWAVPTMSETARAVARTWDGIGIVIFASLWCVGGAILGLLALLTRRSQANIEKAE